ncbi:hypothetical protein ACROYT_G014766 [Oculina patagonica]
MFKTQEVKSRINLRQTRGKASGKKKKAVRQAYADITSLRSFLKTVMPILALTAAVEKRKREGLVKLLGLRSAKIVDVSINNTNIRFSAQNVKDGLNCFNWLVEDIANQQNSVPKTIVFCRSITDLSTLLSYLLMKLGDLAYLDKEKYTSKCLLGVYYSNSPVELKDLVKKSLKFDDGPIRIVLATSALSLGVNFKDIRYVIHYGPAPDLRSLQVGSATHPTCTVNLTTSSLHPASAVIPTAFSRYQRMPWHNNNVFVIVPITNRIKKCAGCPFEFVDVNGQPFAGLVICQVEKDFYHGKNGQKQQQCTGLETRDCWRARLSDFGSAEFEEFEEVKAKQIGDMQMPDVRMRRCHIWKDAP